MKHPNFFDFQLRAANKSSNDLYLLRSPSQEEEYFVKDMSSVHEPRIAIEAEIMASEIIRRESSQLTPLTIDVINPEENVYLIITQKLVGLPLSYHIKKGDKSLKAIIEQAGFALGEIHRISRSTFGSMGEKNLQFPTWEDCFVSNVENQIELAQRKGMLNVFQAKFFQKRIRSLSHGSPTSSSFTHGDYDPSNILVNLMSNKISGIIDFEFSKFWIPEWDLTVCTQQPSYRENPRVLATLISAYCCYAEIDQKSLEEAIDFYKPFESLFFWNWGWERKGLKKIIKQDILQVTGFAK